MKPTKVLTYIVIAAVILIAVFSLMDNGEQPIESNYFEELKSYRHDKDSFMRNNEKSPFVEQAIEYKGLNYFDIDESYKVKASVEALENGKVYDLRTSDDRLKTFQAVAILHFDLLGSHQDLTLLQSADDGLYFLAFYDETSSITTYGAGRYLEISYKKGQNSVILDFNKAYNPYCAYTTGYTCPVPPTENNISIPINAGEKNYE
ncbi:DUF1684 domain-containing protein [Marivirga arenosa]|uniref:DUF1684 domain-containing protein n=1 Tax=Marivirga arenosa TaxID=3059076 RepID=A0AA49GEU6_9BACT|nr:DUF1684 domain-containing protein [Marivirga sp. ABR2-2]WKK87083.2 DUF1684 domain-containing protein [Marivirga sp. ABR2-2]